MPRLLIAALPQDRPLAERVSAFLNERQYTTALIVEDTAQVEPDVDRADAMLVLITPGFADNVINSASLFKALERGLSRTELLVLNVQVDNTPVPAMSSLPEPLRPLAYVGTVELRQHDGFQTDVQALSNQLGAYLTTSGADLPKQQDRPQRASEPQRRIAPPVNVIIIGLILVFAALTLIIPRLRGVEEESLFSIDEPTEEVAPAPRSADLFIGVAASLGNGASREGQEILNGVRLATADYPELIVDDRPISIGLLSQDTGCSASGGLRAAELFTADPSVVGVVGHQCNTSCASAAQLYQQDNFVTISPACEAPELDRLDSFERTVPDTAQSATAAADFAVNALNAENMVVIHDEIILGRQMAEAFRTEVEALDQNIAGFYSVEAQTLDVPTLLADVEALDPGVVFFGGRPEVAAELAAGLDDVPFILGIPDDSDVFIREAAEAAEGTYAAAILPPANPALDALRSRYEEAYGSLPNTLSFAYAYDAATLLLESVEVTTGIDDDLITLDRGALREAVERHQGEGVTGTLNCAQGGSCATPRTQIYVIQDGELVEYTAEGEGAS